MRSPFIGDVPDKRISLCFYGDNTGYRMWNGNNDPITLNTLNGSGLKAWEETATHIIYIDKDYVSSEYNCCFKVNKTTLEISISDNVAGKPLGKLSFTTNANSKTHTFIAKNNKNLYESERLKFTLPTTSSPALTVEQTDKVVWITGGTNV